MNFYVRLASIILCVFLYYGMSCGGGEGGVAGTSDLQEEARPEWYDCLSEDAQTLLDDPDISEEDLTLIEASANCPVEPNTIDKIFAAEEAGSIDEISAHLYRLFAYLDPDQVLPELRGAEVPRGDSIVNMELRWLNDNFASFSPEDQERLMKFILPPPDPNSIFYPLKEGAGAQAAKAVEATPTWETIESPGNWKIFYYPTWKEMAVKVNEAMMTAWPTFTTFFRGIMPKEEIYVYMADTGQQADGYAYMKWADDKYRCNIEVGLTIKDDNWLKATAVHELFHCFHFYLYINNLYNGSGVHYWLMEYANEHRAIQEAAATLSEDLIYPGSNTEHYQLRYFFHGLNEDRLKSDGHFEYGTYMWPFFVKQKYGLEKVQDIIFNTAASENPRPFFVETLPSYTADYADFAMYNSNYPDLLRLYRDINGFPTYDKKKCMGHCGANTESLTVFVVEEPCRVVMEEYLMEGGSMVHWYALKGDKIKQVSFRYNDIFDVPKLNIRVFARYKTGGWKLLGDRNKEGTDTFCLTKPGEDIDRFGIILSNSDLSSKAELTYEIEALPECQPVGTTEINMEGDHVVSFVSRDKIELFPNPDSTSKEKIYVLTERVMSYYDSWSYELVDPDYMLNTRTDVECVGELTETYSRDDFKVKFELDPDNVEGTIYPYPEPFNEQWITCTQTVTTNGVPEVTTWDSIPLNAWPERALTINAQNIQAGRIKGEYVVSVPGFDQEVSLIFEYMRQPE